MCKRPGPTTGELENVVVVVGGRQESYRERVEGKPETYQWLDLPSPPWHQRNMLLRALGQWQRWNDLGERRREMKARVRVWASAALPQTTVPHPSAPASGSLSPTQPLRTGSGDLFPAQTLHDARGQCPCSPVLPRGCHSLHDPVCVAVASLLVCCLMSPVPSITAASFRSPPPPPCSHRVLQYGEIGGGIKSTLSPP